MAEISSKYRVLAGLSESDTSQDTLLLIYLEQAEKKVIKKRFPFGGYTDETKTIALEQFSENVDYLFTIRFNKIGAEGESSHNENGINRSYENESICLDDIPSFVGVM